jgi:PhzF family phenazine biosynthesis protein
MIFLSLKHRASEGEIAPMEIHAFTLNAFAKESGGGNPAGVVLEADDLSDKQMLTIAAEIGFSETAFVAKSNLADGKVRFFTPAAEVDLCGHATIATYFLMGSTGILRPGCYTQETRAGILPIEIRPDGAVFMDQNLPQFLDCVDKAELADSLRISEEAFLPDLPARIVSTGLRDILIPVKSIKQLLNIQPDFQKVAGISRKYGVIGYHLFTLETVGKAAAHCRNLAPLYEIPEEAATGTSNGALACYLFHEGLIAENAGELVFEQGYSMGRPSEIRAELTVDGGEIRRVRVGGTARDIGEKRIILP